MTLPAVYFAYPGDLETQTGGYGYDRCLIDELRNTAGIAVETLALPLNSISPDKRTLERVAASFAALPDQSIVIVDGLAFGVLDNIASAEAHRLRMIALCHHPLALETGLSEAQQNALFASEKRALNCAKATIVTSNHTRQILIDQFDLPASKITAALPGTKRVSFAPCDGDPIRLLSVASLTRRKGHDILVNALGALKALRWQARFVGVADFDPAWTKTLQEQVTALGLSERICFAGSVLDTADEYQQADLFVLPSRFEGYGMVFAEALAAGLPVIGAKAGAVPQVVPESAGILVAADNTQELTEALQNVISNPDLRHRLQEGARAAAAGLATWADTARLVAQKIEEVRKA